MSQPLPRSHPMAAATDLSSADAVARAADYTGAPTPDSEGSRPQRPAAQPPTNPFAFVLFVAVELAFVLGALALTKLSITQVMEIASWTTGLSVTAFFGRNAVVTIGRVIRAGNSER
jgi:hypothetical protein